MTTTVRVEGLRELDAQLQRLKPAAGKAALRRALKTSAQPLADLMRSLAPSDPETGGYDLRASITVSTKLSRRQRRQHKKMFRDDRASVEMFVGAGPLPQAPLQEFGTFSNTPQPFARPAWDQDKDALLDRLEAELMAEVEKTVTRATARGTLRS